MSVNLIAVNVGNTRTRVGVFDGGKLTRIQALDNDPVDELVTKVQGIRRSLEASDGLRTLIASVNPPIDQRLSASLEKEWGQPVRMVEEDLPVPIGRQLDPEAMVGVDRLLNAAAAYDTLKQACVVIDAGTAITIDFVDGAGTFHGGAISPGAGLMLKSLHEHTALLPEVVPAVPDEPIGHNTAQAMLCAVYYGIRGMVRELVEQYAAVSGHYPLVVATGGDASLLFGDDELIDRMVPDLTLRGMALTLEAALTAES